jgi:hypothetical protein
MMTMMMMMMPVTTEIYSVLLDNMNAHEHIGHVTTVYLCSVTACLEHLANIWPY